MDLTNESTRAWIYRIVTALLPLLTALGIVTDEIAPLILAVVAAVLSTGMAARNTSVS